MTGAKSPAQPTCPISYALEIFGDRWTLLVLRDLMLNARRRYKELLACPEGIATNVLADRLKRLEERGLISKVRDPTDARQYLYDPTEAAIGLVPMLFELIAWSAKNGDGQFDPTLLQRISNEREQFIREAQSAIRRRVVAD